MKVVKIRVDGYEETLKLERREDGFLVKVRDIEIPLKIIRNKPGTLLVEAPDGIHKIELGTRPGTLCINGEPVIVDLYIEGFEETRRKGEETTARAGGVVSPMPGRVVKIVAEVGSKVKKGDPLIVIESMKMENIISAPSDGIVKKIHVTVGSTVNKGDPLVEIG